MHRHIVQPTHLQILIPFVLGIGEGIDTGELNSISSDPDSFFVFFVNNFTSLANIETRVVNNTCKGG